MFLYDKYLLKLNDYVSKLVFSFVRLMQSNLRMRGHFPCPSAPPTLTVNDLWTLNHLVLGTDGCH